MRGNTRRVVFNCHQSCSAGKVLLNENAYHFGTAELAKIVSENLSQQLVGTWNNGSHCGLFALRQILFAFVLFLHLLGLISEEENITHGKDILPFQLDLPHTRFER